MLVASAAPAMLSRGEPAPDPFPKIQPLFSKYCFACHAGPSVEGGLALDKMVSREGLTNHRSQWRKVERNLANKIMPPTGEPQPTDEELRQLVSLIADELARSARAMPIDPGRVTLRRLNRAEYDHTIRDLFGIDLFPSNDFPEDDVGHGFDRIGDVLSMPPMLLERYLTAADTIARAVIQDADPNRFRQRVYPAERLRASTGDDRPKDGRFVMTVTSDAYVLVEAPAEGKYRVRAVAYGIQAGSEPTKIGLRVDRTLVLAKPLTAEQDHPGSVETTVSLTPGLHRLAAVFLNDFSREGADRDLVVLRLELDGPIGLAPQPLPAAHRRLLPARPIGKYRRLLLDQALESLLSRAFRRPVLPGEIERYRALIDRAEQAGETPEAGFQLAIKAALTSPHFLFHMEAPEAAAAGPRAESLGDFPLASRLSYFLWNTMPDEELFDLARQGILRDDRILRRQTRRMIADPKVLAFVGDFVGQWLELRKLDNFQPDPKRFGKFDSALRQSMRQESELFFASLLRENRSILDLVDGRYTFLDRRLAKHYGLPTPEGEGFQRVALDQTPRGGVLTHASVLSITSNPTRTSPVKRGKFILETLLGTPPPPPPPNVPELAEAKEAKGTLRERMEQHRANPSCAACHNQLDPLGFGLENFDAVGRWREKEGGHPIDARGVLPDGQRFEGPNQLRRILLGKKELFRRAIVEKLLTYATGRGLDDRDEPAILAIADTVAADGDRIGRLVEEIVLSPPFRQQRREGGSE